MRRRVARWVRRMAPPLLLLPLSLLVALLAGEVLVRLAAPQQLVLLRPDIWTPADTLGWLHRPGVDTEVNTGERTVRFLTDADGYRVGPDGPVDAQRRVLLLGDSFMEALQVEYEQSLAGLMEHDLARILGEPVAVRNAGVGAWDVSHYLLEARRRLAAEDFDLVVVAVYLGNDLVSEAHERFEPREVEERHAFRMPRSLSRDELISAVARPLNDWLEVRSHLAILTKNTLRGVLMGMGLTARYIPGEIMVERRDAPDWSISAGILAEIDALARDRDTPALFVLIPSVYQVDPGLLREHARALGVDPATLDPDQPNRQLGDRMREEGLTVIDLLPELRAAHEQGARLYGTIDPHFAPEGHRVTWEGLSAAVLPFFRPAEVLTSAEGGSRR